MAKIFYGNGGSRDFTGVELAAGTIRGIRRWGVDGAGRLTSLNQFGNRVWKPGENVAVCHACECDPCTRRRRNGEHPRPCSTQHRTGHYPAHPDCKCGFYAYHDGMSHGQSTSAVVTGLIDAYGKVTIGDKGFRAEKARIVALAPDIPGLAPRLRHLYPDVPLYKTLDDALLDFPLSWEYTPDPSNDPEFWNPKPEPSHDGPWLTFTSPTFFPTHSTVPTLATVGSSGQITVSVEATAEDYKKAMNRLIESMSGLGDAFETPETVPAETSPESAAGHDWLARSWYQ